MNKKIVSALLLTTAMCSALSAAALEPVDLTGKVFGIDDGIYEGDGILEAQNWLPNADFHSERRLADGIVDAHTKATVLGFQVAEASARLKIKVTSPGHFDMLDMDSNGAKAGEGQCDATSCTFKAEVMKDKESHQPQLTLEETWVPNENGFELVHGSQLFKGNPAKYEGKFQRKN